MSSQDQVTDIKVEGNRRRRSNRASRGRRPSGKEITNGDAPVAQTSATDVPKVIIQTAPVPPSSIGTTVYGTITDIIRRGKGKFGFINLGGNVKPQEDIPRIYFQLSEYSETEFPVRKGYSVAVKINKDDKDRIFGSEVVLTAAGKVAAAEDKARRAAEASAAPKTASAKPLKEGYGDKPTGEKKVRRRKVDETELVLKVRFEGKAEEKEITARLGKPLGALKRDLATLFEEPGSFAMFINVTSANPKGEFLTRKLLKDAQAGALIFLTPTVEEEKLESS